MQVTQKNLQIAFNAVDERILKLFDDVIQINTHFSAVYPSDRDHYNIVNRRSDPSYDSSAPDSNLSNSANIKSKYFIDSRILE